MKKIAKHSLKILAIFAIFLVLFSTNLFLTTREIQNAKTTLNIQSNQSFCEGNTTELGCINETSGISSWLAIWEIPVFIFLAFLIAIRKPDAVWLYTPLLILLYVLLTELTIKIFNVPVIHTVPKEGDIRILSTAFLGWGGGEYTLITFFALITGYSAAFFGVLRDYIKETKDVA